MLATSFGGEIDSDSTHEMIGLWRGVPYVACRTTGAELQLVQGRLCAATDSGPIGVFNEARDKCRVIRAGKVNTGQSLANASGLNLTLGALF